MKRRKIACLCMALIISTLLTGCNTANIPVIGKLLNKDAAQTTAPADAHTTDVTTPPIDAEYPAVPVGTVITIDDIFNVLSAAGLSADTVAGYLILDANGQEVTELVVNENTYFTFIYQMRDADVSEQSQMVIGVKVTDEVATPETTETTEETTEATDETQEVENNVPAAAKYEVFDFSGATMSIFNYSELVNGTLYKCSSGEFNIESIPHYLEYESIAKPLSQLSSNYSDYDAAIGDKFEVFCFPKSYIYMQALDYEEGADMSAYAGEYVCILRPIYSDYTDPIYKSEDVLLLPLVDGVNEFSRAPSEEAKSEGDFLINEEFDSASGEIDELYGAIEIMLQLSATQDSPIFGNVFNTTIIEYSDMGTPDNLTDDKTWADYEAEILSAEPSASPETAETTETTTTSTTTITETTTTTEETTEEVVSAEDTNSFRSKHPELFTFFPETKKLFSKWDARISNETSIVGTITLEDGTIIPVSAGQLISDLEGYLSNPTFSLTPDTSTGSIFDTNPTTGSDDTTSSSFDDDDNPVTLGDSDYDVSDPNSDEDDNVNEDGSINECEISFSSTTCTVTSNNTYRYMLDNQNSTSDTVYVNHRDKRYTIRVVDKEEYNKYRTSDYLNRKPGGWSSSVNPYVGYTTADNIAIELIDITYDDETGTEITQPYMASVKNGSEYIIIIPDEPEEPGSETMADILKRCVAIK